MRGFIMLCLLLAPALAAHAECGGADLGPAQVAAVRGDASLVLDDGREARLAGIEAGPGARAALTALTVGKAVALRAAETAPADRYGRLLVFATIGGTSIERLLLTDGAARVSARAGGVACAEGLQRVEAEARNARRGLWADPNFAPLRAEPGTWMTTELGRFILVEGRVLSVRPSGGTIYVNFGSRWTRDFTAVIPRRLAGEFRAAGRDPEVLSGRTIRVRGWLERRTGPVIVVLTPEQFELLGKAE
jgi:hypothetical protein